MTPHLCLVLVVGDQAEVLAAARDAAWRDARGRAEQYAALAGVALGGVLRIEEVGGRGPALPLMGRYKTRAAAGPAVEVGEAEVRVGGRHVGTAGGAAARRRWALVVISGEFTRRALVERLLALRA